MVRENIGISRDSIKPALEKLEQIVGFQGHPYYSSPKTLDQ